MDNARIARRRLVASRGPTESPSKTEAGSSIGVVDISMFESSNSTMLSIKNDRYEFRPCRKEIGDSALLSRVPLEGECGLACLAIAFKKLNISQTFSDLVSNFPTEVEGLTMAELRTIALENGVNAEGYRTTPAGLSELNSLAILHWHNHHYVLLNKIVPEGIHVYDPASCQEGGICPQLEYSFKNVSHLFSGALLRLTAGN